MLTSDKENIISMESPLPKRKFSQMTNFVDNQIISEIKSQQTKKQKLNCNKSVVQEKDFFPWDKLPFFLKQIIINQLLDNCVTLVNLHLTNKTNHISLLTEAMFLVPFKPIRGVFLLDEPKCSIKNRRMIVKKQQQITHDNAISDECVQNFILYDEMIQQWQKCWHTLVDGYHIVLQGLQNFLDFQPFLKDCNRVYSSGMDSFHFTELGHIFYNEQYCRWLDILIKSITRCSLKDFNNKFIETLTGKLHNEWYPFAKEWINKDYVEVVNLLLERGMDSNCEVYYDFDQPLEPILICAARANANKIVHALLNSGANINIYDTKYKQTALYHVLYFQAKELLKDNRFQELFNLQNSVIHKKIKTTEKKLKDIVDKPGEYKRTTITQRLKKFYLNKLYRIRNFRATINILLSHHPLDKCFDKLEIIALYPQWYIRQLQQNQFFQQWFSAQKNNDINSN